MNTLLGINIITTSNCYNFLNIFVAIRDLKKNMTMSSKINDADSFEKYNKIWKKIEEF